MMACIAEWPSGRITSRAGQLTALSALLLLAASIVPVSASAAPGETELVSSTVDGKGAGGYAGGMSPDARFVAFTVWATDVLPGGNPAHSLLLKDRLLGTTRFVVRNQGGLDTVTVSADGRYVAFVAYWDLLASDTNGQSDVYVRDLLAQQTVLASVSSDESASNGYTSQSMISANGRYVVFESTADGLVPGDTNGESDVFVRDLQSGTTERVSISSGEAQANANSLHSSISADGRFVVFDSYATNLVPGDTNNSSDVFLRDRVAGTTERISVASDGSQADIYSYASAGPPATMTPDGRFVVFASYARNLVANDTNQDMDVFVRDRLLGRTERVSVSSTGIQANAISMGGTVSRDGRYVAFESKGSTLVPGDLNNRFDVFVRDREVGTTVRVSVSTLGVQGNADSYPSMISADGRLVVFNSMATNLVDNETQADRFEVYLHEMGTAPGAPPFVVDPGRLLIENATIWADTTRTVTFTNTGSAAISVRELSLSGAHSAQFRATHVCGSSVPAGGACLIKITARPTSTGLKTARLSVAAGNATQAVELSATGILAQFTLTPTALGFPPQRVGTQSAGQWVKVRNTGAGVMPVNWVGLVGPDASQFSRQRWCPAQLDPGRVCNVPVYFKPTSTGAKSARLIVSPGRSGSPRHVALSGTGI